MAPRMGRRGTGAIVAVLLAMATAQGRESHEPGDRPVVLVPPFENQSRHHERISYEVATGADPDRPKRSYAVDRYTEAPRSLLEDALGQLRGITIVERQRVDALLVEARFGALSGMVDTENALRLGKLLGANLIVLGSVVDIRDETRTFRGYGIATKTTEVVCTLRVRLLEGGTGTVKFSKLVKGTKSYSASTYGGTASSDRNFAAIEAAVEALQADPQFRAAVTGGQGRRGGRRDGGGRVRAEAGELRRRDRRQVRRRLPPEAPPAGREGVQGADQQGRVQGLGKFPRPRAGPADHARA